MIRPERFSFLVYIYTIYLNEGWPSYCYENFILTDGAVKKIVGDGRPRGRVNFMMQVDGRGGTRGASNLQYYKCSQGKGPGSRVGCWVKKMMCLMMCKNILKHMKKVLAI